MKKLCRILKRTDEKGGNTKSNMFSVLASLGLWFGGAGGMLAVGLALPCLEELPVAQQLKPGPIPVCSGRTGTGPRRS